MGNKIKIKDFLCRKKEAVRIDPNNEYSLTTVRLHHKGVILRERKKGNLIKSKMFKISEGQFILSGIDARNGAFGIVPKELDGALITNDFWTFEINEKIVKRDFFYWFTNTPLFLEVCHKSSKGETQRIRLQKELFINFEFHFPPIEKQEEFLKQLNLIDASLAFINREQNNQTSYITLLRQSILQDAIEGKLTVEWRKKNPVKKGDPETDAAALLEKIKKEKQKLIAEGKIKKDKPLTTIKPEEIPFKLPPGWLWTRLGEVCTKITDGFHNTPPKLTSGKIYISATHIREQGINWDGCLYVSEKDHNDLFKKAYPQKGEILITNRGAGCGTPALIDIDENFSFQNAALIGFNQSLILSKYIHNFLLFMRKTITDEFVNGGLQPMLSNTILNTIPVPIPPIAEQRAIVERVDELSGIVDELEKEAAARQTLSENLMQAVLKEAFEGGGGED